MKKTLLVFFLPAFLIACKGKSNPSPVINTATVKYSYSSASKATCEVVYTGVNGTPTDTIYTGGSFIKTIVVNRSSGFKIAHFKISLVAGVSSTSSSGEMIIYDNGSFDQLKDIDLSGGHLADSLSTSVFGN